MTDQATRLLGTLPENGKSMGNVTLRKLFATPEEYIAAKTELLTAGLITLGRGKGGSVRRIITVAEPVSIAAVTA